MARNSHLFRRKSALVSRVFMWVFDKLKVWARYLWSEEGNVPPILELLGLWFWLITSCRMKVMYWGF